MSNNDKMSRRGFFKRSFSKAASVGNEFVEHKVAEKAKNWIRPPFAQIELDFLLKCSRCSDCIDACPHQVIFPLPVQRGASVVATPAMDILNKACHLCTDWPCVTACKEDALSFDVVSKIAEIKGAELSTKDVTEGIAEGITENRQVSDEINHNISSVESIEMPSIQECPPMASATLNKSMCMPYSGPECGACRGTCPIEGVLTWKNEKPSINIEKCVGCGLCREACITSPKAIDITTYSQPVELDPNLQSEPNIPL